VETKRFVGSTVNVILTRQTCGQRWSRAARGKRRALAFYFSIRIWCMFGGSKCTGDSDLSVHTTLELAKTMRLHSRGDGGWAKRENKERVPKNLGHDSLLRGPKKTRETSWADFAVITSKLWWIMTAIFVCLALSWIKCSFFCIIGNYCKLQKTPPNWMWVQLLWEFGHFELQLRFFVSKNCTILVFFHSRQWCHAANI